MGIKVLVHLGQTESRNICAYSNVTLQNLFECQDSTMKRVGLQYK